MSTPRTPLQSIRSSVSTTVDTYEITGAEIVAALRETGRLPAQNATATSERAEAWVRVPGGGDWSSTTLDLADHLVAVRITTETRA